MDKTIYTVPLHVGETVEVPMGMKVVFYQHCLRCEVRLTDSDRGYLNEDGNPHICMKADGTPHISGRDEN